MCVRVFFSSLLSTFFPLLSPKVEHMINEKTILMKMNHPFIVKLAGTFHDERSLFMILEYVVGGEFFSHLRRANRFENHVGR